MHFVFVSTIEGAPWGGSEELWSQCALRLLQRGHEVSASVIYWPRLAPKTARLKEQGVNLFVRVSGQSGRIARVWHKVTRARREYVWTRRQNPDLFIISQGGHSDGLRWMKFCRQRRLPFVVIAHSVCEAWWPSDELAEELKRAYRAARGVFGVCQYGLNLLEMMLGEPHGEIVRNPYNMVPDPSPSWPRDDGTWRLASVGLLQPAVKGHDLLFQVLARPQWRDRPYELNVYGDGPCKGGLHRLADHLRLKNVRFHGHVSDIKKVWEHNHILVMPSRFEGLPLTLVESMWCARPAIMTKVGGVAELCVDGQTGFLAPAPTVSLLEETMEHAWTHRDRWAAMGKAARARAELLIPADPVEIFCRRLIELARSDGPGQA